MPKNFSFDEQCYDFLWPTFKFINYVIVTKDEQAFVLERNVCKWGYEGLFLISQRDYTLQPSICLVNIVIRTETIPDNL